MRIIMMNKCLIEDKAEGAKEVAGIEGEIVEEVVEDEVIEIRIGGRMRELKQANARKLNELQQKLSHKIRSCSQRRTKLNS